MAVTTAVRKDWDKGSFWSVGCSKKIPFSKIPCTQTSHSHYLQAYTFKILPTRASCSTLHQFQVASAKHSCLQHDLYNTFPLLLKCLSYFCLSLTCGCFPQAYSTWMNPVTHRVIESPDETADLSSPLLPTPETSIRKILQEHLNMRSGTGQPWNCIPL